MEGPEQEGAWRDEVEARLREAIARALEGTAQQILANGVARRTPVPQATASDPEIPADHAEVPRAAAIPGATAAGPDADAGPTRGQMLEIIGRHMAEGQEHFGRDGRPLASPDEALHAMEEDGFIIVGQRVALPAGYRGV